MARRSRLYSDKSRFGSRGAQRRHHRARAGEPLGYISYRHEPLLDFEPGYQYSHSLRGDGQQYRHESDRCQPANRQYRHPTGGVGAVGPTGQVANTTSSFPVGNGGDNNPAHFIFANLNGTISAWDTGATAHTQVTTQGAVYTGLAISQNLAQPLLYAANGAGSGSINVFDKSFTPVNLGPNAFATPSQVPNGFVPFNVQNINGNVYVTYAPPGRPAQISATPGMGAVAIFDENGKFQRMATADSNHLAAPWGLALAPAGFGSLGGDLLVGNFSFSSMANDIDIFDSDGNFVGTIPINVGIGNAKGGLWALEFGTGGMNGSPNTLFFTDGINGEMDGLFGALNAVPGPIAGAGLPGLISAGGDGGRKPVWRTIANAKSVGWAIWVAMASFVVVLLVLALGHRWSVTASWVHERQDMFVSTCNAMVCTMP